MNPNIKGIILLQCTMYLGEGILEPRLGERFVVVACL